jgi:hypothetical protein
MNHPNIQKLCYDHPTNKLDAAATLLHLVTFGLVAVMIVLLFGLASSSWLSDVRKETLVSSRIREAGIEFLYPRSAVVPYTADHAAPPPATIADLPSSVRETVVLPSAGQNLATSDVQPVGPISSSNFEPLSDSEANPTMQETWDAPSTQAVPIDKTIGASQESAPVSMPPPAQLRNAIPTALPPVPAVPIPDKQRDRLFEAFGTQHPQPAKFDERAKTTSQTTPAQPVQNKRANEHFLGLKAAFQYRVKKECGPIHDPQLRLDCISSFSAYHR